MMFLRYESFREYIRFYPVNTVLLVVMIGVHLAFAVWSAVSGFPANALKMEYGAFVRIPDYDIVPEYWRYVSSVFLHADFAHLLFNAFAVFVFAPPLERALGAMRYAVLFLFSGIMGNIVTMLLYPEPELFGLGASGSVYGVFGAYLFYMLFRRRAMDPGSQKTLQTLLIVGIIYSIVIPQVNLYAHLGGLVGGLVLNALYTRFLQGRG
jgi:rhomboid protease GluP